MTSTTSGIKRRGFASLTPERRREIASMGGKQAHQQGTAHQFSSAEAQAAGRKGGLARWQARPVKPPEND